MTTTAFASAQITRALLTRHTPAISAPCSIHCCSIPRPYTSVHTKRTAIKNRDLTWQARARRNGGPDDGWQTRDEYQDFPRSTDGRRSSRGQGDRQRNPFDSPFDSLNGISGITEQWEQRAEDIQRDAQRTARQAAEKFGVKDYRVEPMRPDDLSKFVLPVVGVAAFAALAGPMIGLVLGGAGLVVGATLFSGSVFFAMTFALPLLFGASVMSMLGFWTFGIFSVAASLALPVLVLAGAFSVMKMLAGGGRSPGTSGPSAPPMSAEERAAAAATAKADAEWRQEQEDDRRRDAELRDFDDRLNQEERRRDRRY